MVAIVYLGGNTHTHHASIYQKEQRHMRLYMTNLSLTQARLDLGLSQGDLASRLGVSLKQVWRWENGIAQPRLYYRQLLCTFFHRTPEELGLCAGTQACPVPTSLEASTEVSFRDVLEGCLANPAYQSEYQAFLQRCRRFTPYHRQTASFIEWLLAAHPEATSSDHDRGFHQPA